MLMFCLLGVYFFTNSMVNFTLSIPYQYPKLLMNISPAETQYNVSHYLIDYFS